MVILRGIRAIIDCVCKSQFNGERILLSGQDQMAQTQRAMNLLAKIAGPAVAKAKVEAKEIQDLIDKTVALN
jgi:hypothetical protein